METFAKAQSIDCECFLEELLYGNLEVFFVLNASNQIKKVSQTSKKLDTESMLMELKDGWVVWLESFFESFLRFGEDWEHFAGYATKAF